MTEVFKRLCKGRAGLTARAREAETARRREDLETRREGDGQGVCDGHGQCHWGSVFPAVMGGRAFDVHPLTRSEVEMVQAAAVSGWLNPALALLMCGPGRRKRWPDRRRNVGARFRKIVSPKPRNPVSRPDTARVFII